MADALQDYTQQEHLLSITSSLGPDVLILTEFSGDEGLSNLFSYRLTLLSKRDDIKPTDLVGQHVAFVVTSENYEPRYFNGYVSSLTAGSVSVRGFREYYAEVVPWLWFLTRTSNCRIFQEKTTKEIISKVFDDRGFTDYKFSLNGADITWEYCVQYRETDFNFVSRLMEQLGFFYFFSQESDKHIMVISDNVGAYQDVIEKNVEFNSGSLPIDHIFEWVHKYSFRSGKLGHSDYDFKDPSNKLRSNTNTLIDLPTSKNYEFYDYPGEYTTKAEGDSLIRVRMEEEEVPHEVVQGESSCRSFTPGGKFKLTKHLFDSESKGKSKGTYVFTQVKHIAISNTYITGDGEGEVYSNTFTCIPSTVIFRPPRITPKPNIAGVQTAVVTGPSGEEIYTDKYGRVKVQFHWDREGKGDDVTSCWIRVAQYLAGKNWGAMFLPRIGQEVVVEFLEGDPDRPLIVGSVYNKENMPAYTLPNEKTKSGIKTLSSKGGGGFNEIRFEDDKGSEQIFIHAEKNQDNRVKEDSIEWVGKDRHLIVIENQFEKVDKDKHLTVIGDQNEKVDGTVSLDGGADLQQKISANYALEAGGEIHLKAGSTIVLEANTQISFKVGGNFIDISASGVSIVGTMVNINSGGSPGSGSGASPDTAIEPIEADEADPGDVSEYTAEPVEPGPVEPGPMADALAKAHESGAPFCAICEEARRQREAAAGGGGGGRGGGGA